MDRDSLRALFGVGDLVGLSALSFGLALLLIWGLVVERRVMPIGLLRILTVEQHLRAGAGPIDGVALLGSSVVVEGVDCERLRTALPPDTRCENLAWTGADVRQWLLVTPALLESPPRVVVFGLDLFTLLNPDELSDERLAIAGWWDFVPAAERPAYGAILDPEALRILESSRVAQLLRFRAFPLNALNERVREVARSDLRYDDYATDFSAPWVRRQAATATALAVHLELVRTMIRKGGTERLPETERLIEFLIGRIRARAPDTRFLLVLTPVHPELSATLPPGALDEVRQAVRALAERLHAEARDDTLALGASAFSDAVHPFGEGRTQWSLELGRAVARLLPH